MFARLMGMMALDARIAVVPPSRGRERRVGRHRQREPTRQEAQQQD